MRFRTAIAAALVSAAFIAAPLAPASAHDHWGRRGGGLIFGLGAAVGALAVGAATIVSAPFVALAGPPAPRGVYVAPGYAPPPVAYYPPPAYYPAYPAYAYAPPPGAYYAYPTR